MCGIIGYIGKNNSVPILLDGLHNLEYRGYDSVGISIIENNKLKIIKDTRWATHGKANKTNAHPHHFGHITIVHNGILENYLDLKSKLEKNGYKFISETDTEVACAYINYIYNKEKDILKTLNICTKDFIGSYAIGIIVEDDYDNLYVMKKESPLIIGVSKDENFIASDVPAIINYTNKYILLEDMEYAKINSKNIEVYKNGKKEKKTIKEFKHNLSSVSKEKFDHYMLKEINEQPLVIDHLIIEYFKDGKLIKNKLPNLSLYNKIYIVGCGSAYHAGIVGKCLLEKYGNSEVFVELASEFRYKKLFLDENCLVIAISQSGETADTLASLKIAKHLKAHTLSIVNVYESSIARFTDDVIYTEAGNEIAVATTKGYTSQVFILSLLALKLGLLSKQIKEKDVTEYYKIISKEMKKLIKKDYKDIALDLYKRNCIFFIGRNIDYALSLEGSLKLKEISYIHAECYAAGELKHGTISLIEKNTPVIALITNDNTADKTISNVKEVISRGAYVIIINKDSIKVNKCYDKKITIPTTIDLLQPILNIIPLQLIAYEVAKLKKCDIDKPRNLAKSVTVE